MSWALLFPGQGSQQPGLLHRLPAGAATERTLAEAADVLTRPVPGDGDGALDAPAAMATDTVAIQLALLIAGTAAARTLLADGPPPDHVAGHSVGAVTAAVAAGVLDLTDALDLVRLRATRMAAAYPSDRGYGMGAVTGLPEARVHELVRQARADGAQVYASNVNAPDQVAVSGSGPGLALVLELARAAGARSTRRLPVPVPAHCPLMTPARDAVAERLAELLALGRLRRPACGWVGNVAARLLRRPEQIARDLAAGITEPVRWDEVTTTLYERGTRLFVEAHPGEVLTRLAAAAFPRARSVAMEQAGLDSVRTLIGRAGPSPCTGVGRGAG